MHTYLLSTLAGVLIGCAAVVLMGALGRIAGISGIAAGLMDRAAEGDRVWRWAFLFGLILAPWCFMLWSGREGIGAPQVHGAWLMIAGLLVGLGTRLGSGCTSGHGVCGLARFSRRSLLATLVFMLFGVLTVFVVRHGLMGVSSP